MARGAIGAWRAPGSRGGWLSAQVATRSPGVGRVLSAKAESIRGLFLLPVAILVGVVVGLWRLIRRAKPLAKSARFAIEPDGPPMTDVAAYAARIQSESMHERPGYGTKDFLMVYAPDLIPSVLDIRPRFSNRFFSCPPPFRRVVIESLDGTPISAEVAAREDVGRPGLVVVHGVFGSSGQRIYSDQAVRAYADWGFNVAIIDLRGWSRSATLSNIPMSGGWREAEDVLAAAKWLLENTATSTVGAIGFSLGGASVLLAAAHDRAPELLRSGVLSEAGYVDAREVVRIIDRNPGLMSREHLAYRLFTVSFSEKFRCEGRGRMSITDYFERVSAPYYGVSVDELYDMDSVVNRVDRIRVPALHIHAADDWVVHVRHAERLRAAAEEAGNRLVGVCVKPRGAHCAFSRVAPAWRDRVAREYFAATSGVRLLEPVPGN